MDMMGILTLLLSVFAMITALASVWYTSETIKKANVGNKKFYEANIKDIVKTMEELSKSDVQSNWKVDALVKAEKKSDPQVFITRLQEVESTLGEVRASLEALLKYVPSKPRPSAF